MTEIQKTYKRVLQAYLRFCPHCGERLKLRVRDHDKELTCVSCEHVMWLNSKPTASCLLINEKKEVLLSKRGIKPLKSWWDVPGGFLKLGEPAEAGVRREIKEELGIRLTQIKMLPCIYAGTYQTTPLQITFNTYFAAKISSHARLTPQDDVVDAKWFHINKLPKIAFANNQKALRYLVRNFANFF